MVLLLPSHQPPCYTFVKYNGEKMSFRDELQKEKKKLSRLSFGGKSERQDAAKSFLKFLEAKS